MIVFPGALANTAGGEEEDGGDGHSRGEDRWGAGSLQWSFCLTL